MKRGAHVRKKSAQADDVLDPNASENANIDVGDVINYICASDYAISRLKELPLCMRFLKDEIAIIAV